MEKEALGVEDAAVCSGAGSLVEFVFLHSYSSRAQNWHEVFIGAPGREGRVLRALRLARTLGVGIVANDAHDCRNGAIFVAHGIRNLSTAERTLDEVRSALDLSQSGRVLFVTSPDHLPRVARDALAMGGTSAMFAASDVPFSWRGAASVEVTEPGHEK